MLRTREGAAPRRPGRREHTRMVENDPQVTGEAGAADTTAPVATETTAPRPRRRRAASRPAGPPAPAEPATAEPPASAAEAVPTVAPAADGGAAEPVKAVKATRTRARKTTKKAAAAPAGETAPAEAGPTAAAPVGAVSAEAPSAESPPGPPPTEQAAPKRRRRATKAAPSAETAPAEALTGTDAVEAPAETAATETAPTETASTAATPRKRARRRATAPAAEPAPAAGPTPGAEPAPGAEVSGEAPPAEPPTEIAVGESTAGEGRPTPRKRARRATKAAGTPAPEPAEAPEGGAGAGSVAGVEAPEGAASAAGGPAFQSPVFQAPRFTVPERATAAIVGGDDVEAEDVRAEAGEEAAGDEEGGTRRRRRRRGGRGRRKDGTDPADAPEDGAEQRATEPEGGTEADDGNEAEESEAGEPESDESAPGGSRRRRRRRRRRGEGEDDESDEPNTVVRIREPRPRGEVEGEVTGLKGSTRLEAKKQRRREGREAGRRRPPIVSEAEFLARREAVDRVMVVRQAGGRTQIAVLEDGVLVEHYVSREQQQSMIGNVYLGKVQNVLPAMEAAFVDIGRGRNAVLYAGEVDWAGLGLSGGPKRIEEALKSGQSVLVQVTKDPVGHKGARLTSQVSLPGRYLVYVPGGSMSGISRKLPDTERNRLKRVLKQVVPDDAGVIVRTAAEGASEEELTRDVARLTAQWEDIAAKASSGSAPQLLYGEPDLMIKVVRDLFNEDFAKLVVAGDDAWDTVEPYVSFVAPSLAQRLERWVGTEDVFTHYRVDEQIAKALDRKVWLPSGGSLVIDRTEAMTVVDVNTGKFTGSGGNLEQTVTKNNLEAAEEVVRQLRLRDIGGIIVIDFIDMVLESNRDLVLRRLVECLGRDRTKHQVAEVTSLGLVQMTRKKIGAGLVEAFSETCDQCKGRGVIVRLDQVGSSSSGGPGDGAAASGSASAPTADGDGGRPARRRRGGRSARSAGGAPPTEAAREAATEPATAGA
jgi:ribonuclease E